LNYSIVITNQDTGETEQLTSFTNVFVYKGRVGGTYKAVVRAVGRDGTTSLAQDITFLIQSDVMLLEGAKNGVDVLGVEVSEDFQFIEGHKIFVWGAATIDRLIAGINGNTTLAFELYIGNTGSTIEEAVFLENIELYPATESSANLDTDALGGTIVRNPTPPEGADIRGTTFETSFSTMFSPLTVTEALQGQTFVFFLRAIGRAAEDDVTSLSISIWSAFAGQSAIIPGDPFTPEPAVVVNDFKSITLDQTNDEWLRAGSGFPVVLPQSAGVLDPFRVIAGSWTFAIWVNPNILNGLSGGSPADEVPQVITHRIGLTPLDSSRSYGFNINLMRLSWLYGKTIASGGGAGHQIQCIVGDGPNVGSPTTHFRRMIFNELSGSSDVPTPGRSTIFPNGPDSQPAPYWTLIAVRFAIGVGVEFFSNGALLTAISEGFFSNFDSGTNFITMTDETQQDWIFGCDASQLYTAGVYLGPSTTPVNVNTYDGLIHSAGVWNRRLRASEITALYNDGNGAAIHWRNNAGDYEGSNNLIHYWQFGAVDSELKYVGRDTGFTFNDDGGRANTTDIGNDDEPNTSDDTFAANFTLDNVVDRYPGE
jgi:hypothetical protein